MSERREDQRRQADRRASGRALVPAAGPDKAEAPHPTATEPRRRGGADPNYQAQLLGQDGQKRGLRGGKEVLDQARSTYLGSEYSGAADRRPRPGRTTKTEV